MDPLARLAEWLDSRGWVQGDRADQYPVDRDSQVNVTISFGRRKLDGDTPGAGLLEHSDLE